MRNNYSTGARWESIVGYSRAVKIGNIIEVSGTVSFKDGEAFAMGDPYGQTKRILEIIGQALEHFGASHANVIRTRTFVTNIKDWARVAKAHEEVYGKIRPATSLLEVSALITPAYMVEIEVSAVVS
jgi:enamine deaminase RidA (YjgF/YER057c/UK114 family)